MDAAGIPVLRVTWGKNMEDKKNKTSSVISLKRNSSPLFILSQVHNGTVCFPIQKHSSLRFLVQVK